MRAPFLAVTRLAIHILVGTIAGNDRIQGFGAVFALEAFAMPFLNKQSSIELKIRTVFVYLMCVYDLISGKYFSELFSVCVSVNIETFNNENSSIFREIF